MVLVAREIFAFLFLEIYMAPKVEIKYKQLCLLFIVSKAAPGEGHVKERVCAVQFLP